MESLISCLYGAFFYLSAVFLVVLSVGFACYTAYIGYIHWKFSHLPGPEIKGFYLGNLAEIREFYKRGEYSHKLFLQWAQIYGPVFRIFLLHRCMVLVTGKTMIKELLTKSKYRKSSDSYKRVAYACGERFLGNGLVTNTDHEDWFKKRSIIGPAFHKKYLKMLMEQFNSTADEWIDQFAPFADGKTQINMADYMCRVTLEVIGKVGFNFDIGALQSSKNLFSQAISKVLEGFSLSFKDPLMALRPSKRNYRKEVRREAKFLRSQGKSVLENRMQEMKEGKDVPSDILSFIIKCAEVCPGMTMEDMLDEFATLFVAGQETTSNALTFLFHELGRHPYCYTKLREEVDRVLDGENYVSYDKLSQLEYMTQVLKETLRLYPPAPGTARTTPCDSLLDGFLLPRGSFVVISFFVTHRLPQYHKNPEEFDPERFNPDEPRPLYTYMPFSMGQRSCAGQHFAMIEAKVLLCKFLSKFKYTVDPTQTLEVQETTTLRPRDGCRMVISTRET